MSIFSDPDYKLIKVYFYNVYEQLMGHMEIKPNKPVVRIKIDIKALFELRPRLGMPL